MESTIFERLNMIKKQVYSFVLLCFLSSCMQSGKVESHDHPFYVDLNETAEIVMQLILTDQAHKLLERERVDKGALHTFIKNLSPAMIAFESEVLLHDKPVAVCYYLEDQKEECVTMLTRLHEALPNYKYVVVDIEELFDIAQTSLVEDDEVPILIVINNREEVARYSLSDYKDDIQTIESKLRSLA